jgi:hypothetical protein
MANPKLKTCRVVVNHSCTDGYSANAAFKGKKEFPGRGLISAIYELSRLATLHGLDVEAVAAFENARSDVNQWKLEQFILNGCSGDDLPIQETR